MNSYFNSFVNITQSVEQLLKSESNSSEIKQSATDLNESVQPCIEELKQSAIRLKRLVLVCSDELYHAENVWFSKPKIAEAAKSEIWAHLGEISGCSTRVRYLGEQCKNEAIEQVKKSWGSRIKYLMDKYFNDVKGQIKKSIGWTVKEGFINEAKSVVDSLCAQVGWIVKEKLRPVYKEITDVQLKSIQYYISLLDQKKRAELSKQLNSIASEIQAKLDNPLEHLPKYHIDFKITVGIDLKALIEQGWGDIQREEVVKFKDKVLTKIDTFISAIFDDRVKLATETIAKAIKFYNDFLEQQERYQQETPEQREAEKAWIDNQRQELARVQDGIHVLLSGN